MFPRCVSQKNKDGWTSFFLIKYGWRLPETLTHLTFDIPERLPSKKGKEVVFQLRFFSGKTCLKKLQRCMDLDKLFIVFSFSGFSPVFGHPEFCLGEKTREKLTETRRFLLERCHCVPALTSTVVVATVWPKRRALGEG